jgi:hypothetical protein
MECAREAKRHAAFFHVAGNRGISTQPSRNIRHPELKPLDLSAALRGYQRRPEQKHAPKTQRTHQKHAGNTPGDTQKHQRNTPNTAKHTKINFPPLGPSFSPEVLAGSDSMREASKARNVSK